MYDFIRGKLFQIDSESVTIDVNGVGYKIYTTNSTMKTLLHHRGELLLYVSFVVREFSHSFYGFLQAVERDFFEALLNVSGIGPKTALNIIGTLSFDELSQALVHKDLQTLCRVPGIGKKTAERLLIELKGMLPLLSSHTTSVATHSLSQDAISALMNLGYTQQIAQKAVGRASTDEAINDLSSLITRSLKEIGSVEYR